jgi:hypothetical protein
MRYLVLLIASVVGIAAAPAFAGPVDQALPANPCPAPNGSLKLRLIANEVGTDWGGAACGVGGGCAETMVICHHTGKTGSSPVDVAIELFDSGGNLIAGIASACGVTAGATADFATSGVPLVPPYITTNVIAVGPQVPLGSLRVLSTGRVACDVTLMDTSAWAAGLAWTTSTKDVTVTKTKSPQKGD